MSKKCDICGEKAIESVGTAIEGKVVKTRYFCAKHYVQSEGEECLRCDLDFIRKSQSYDDMNAEVVKEIWLQYPEIAKDFAAELRKIVKKGETDKKEIERIEISKELEKLSNKEVEKLWKDLEIDDPKNMCHDKEAQIFEICLIKDPETIKKAVRRLK